MWDLVVANLMGGFCCVAMGLEATLRAKYAFEPVLGPVVLSVGVLEWGWTGWQLIAAKRLRKNLLRTSSPKQM